MNSLTFVATSDFLRTQETILNPENSSLHTTKKLAMLVPMFLDGPAMLRCRTCPGLVAFGEVRDLWEVLLHVLSA